MSRTLTIGIDLGGTQLRVALFDGGTILRRVAELTDVHGGPMAVVAQFQNLIDQIVTADERPYLKNIGVSSPGPIDTEAGVVMSIPTIRNWENFALRDTLQDRIKLPVIIENDAIAAAFGEWRHGAGQGLRHMIYATVSTGLGGGAVVDGHLLHGRQGMATHFGHFRLAQDGPVCGCGATACFEALASGTALGRNGREAALKFPISYLGRAAHHGDIDAKAVVEGARASDAVCLQLIKDEAIYLGQGFTGLIHLFSPERVVMGGGVSQAFDLLDDDMHAIIRRDAMIPYKTIKVVPAQLGDNAGLIGAAALAAEQLA